MSGGYFCAQCGERGTATNGMEECPVSRYQYREMYPGDHVEKREGEVHGLSHLWARHVERWFNYSGPRGAERGWPENATEKGKSVSRLGR